MNVTGSVSEYLKALTAAPGWRQQIVFQGCITARPSETVAVSIAWPPVIERILKAQGIVELYRHQAEAVNLIRAGRHTVIATPTASGKTLIYNLPVLEKCAAQMDARALYIFPLKALAQDQLGTLKAAAECCEDPRPTVAVYDGDTSQWHRRKTRQAPRTF